MHNRVLVLKQTLMKFKTLASYAATLLIGLALGFLLARNVDSKVKSPVAEVIQEENEQTSEADTTTVQPEVVDTTLSSPDPAREEDASTSPTTKKDVASLIEPTLCYDQNDKQFRQDLLVFTQGLERDSIWYKQRKQGEPDLLEDCSGIFHRVKNYFASKCDAYQYPDVSTTRDTRALAAWFHKQENLVIVKDPAQQRNLIKPGTVMFFGISDKVYNNLSVERVLAPRPQHVIMHVGIVTDTELDNEGNVKRYTLFHGRSNGKIASSTYYHQLDPPKAGFPKLGNWNQQLVAMASLMTPKR